MSILHTRVRRARESVLIRSWQYRQRNHAQGVWYRLRRVLVDASEAWTLDDLDADRLEREGYPALPVGGELDPAKRIFVLTPARLSALPSRKWIPMRLGQELLEARNVALVPHPEPPS
jgi:hypothetical protein